MAAVAYIFTFPLVMRYRRLHRQAVDSGSPVYSGGFGTWRDESVTVPRRSGNGRPNVEVVYSSAWLDLRAEPWWCEVGEVSPDLSFHGVFVDLWGFPIADVEPSRAGPVLASAPQRVRDVPPQVRKIVRGESSVVEITTVTTWRDPYRVPGTPPTRPDVVLDPVTSHLHRPPPRRSRRIADVAPWLPWFEGLETTDEYWPCATFALSLTAPNHDDRDILDEIAHIGIVPGAPWSPAAFPRVVADAIRDGMDDALSDLMAAAAESDDDDVPSSRRTEMDRDYFTRALSVLRPERRIGA